MEKARKHKGKAKKTKKNKNPRLGEGTPCQKSWNFVFFVFVAFPLCFLAFSGMWGGEQCWEGLAEKPRKHKGKANKNKQKQKSKTSMGEGTPCQKS